jgi:hypothetical protein
MNWRNVAHLICVDMKSGRLLRGRRLTRYREHRLFTYLAYGGALVLGLVIGGLVGVFYASAAATDLDFASLVKVGMQSLLLSLPTIVLIYGVVLTMLQQIQRSGAKFSSQAQYWLPITWGEHTLASVLASMLGMALITIVFIASAVIVFSTFTGQIVQAVSSVLGMCAAAFMASVITEILRILQVRFVGAVYKSTGRAAVWVRFIGSLTFFLVFYLIYFYVISGSGGVTIIQSVASAQSVIWFVPFVWLAMTLYSFMNGLLLQGLAFSALSLLFIFALFYLATLLNKRFGLYEPPAITVSHGLYAPKTGFLGRLGFSTVEAALIRKDLKAFTRRRELMTIFILPIVFIIAPLMQSLGTTGALASSASSPYFFAVIFLLPASAMAVFVGSFMTGEEGQAVWRIYSSPISAKNLVKSKYFIVIFFSILVLAVTGIVGFLILHPSLRAILVTLVESVFLVFALGSLSLSMGIKGADFTEVPRPRMVRPLWNFLNMAACFVTTIIILTPFLPYVLSTFLPGLTGPLVDLYTALVLSAIISVVSALIFYQIALKNAKELLTRAEI